MLGYRNEDLVSFELSLNNPSQIAELQELEHWRTKFDVAGAALEGFFSRRWVATNLFNISDEEFLRNQRESFYDRKYQATLDSIVEQGLEAEGGAGGLPGMPGEEPMPGGPDEIPPEEAAAMADETPGEEPAPEGGEEDILLAAPPTEAGEAPAKRDKDWYKKQKRNKKGQKITTTSKSKGKWYVPVAGTGGDRRIAGARHRNKKAKYSDSTARATHRNVVPGLDDLITLSKGIYEQKESTYSDEEKKVFNINTKTKSLIKELESRDNETETQ